MKIKLLMNIMVAALVLTACNKDNNATNATRCRNNILCHLMR